MLNSFMIEFKDAVSKSDILRQPPVCSQYKELKNIMQADFSPAGNRVAEQIQCPYASVCAFAAHSAAYFRRFHLM
jgi:hypothetical protein